MNKKCKYCGSVLIRKKLPKAMETTKNFRNRMFCNKKCYTKWACGKNHHAWKGGIKISKDGYIKLSKDGTMFQRFIVEKSIGRKLSINEVVHHKDGNKKNNDLSNLLVLNPSEHSKIHTKFRNRDYHGRFI